MFKKKYEVTVESGCAMGFVKILGEHAVRFDVSNEWFVVDPNETDKKTWYRTFRIYTTARKMAIIEDQLSYIW